MGIQLSPRKQAAITDVVHNSKNTSASDAKKILETTADQAIADQMFTDMLDNWSEIRASLRQLTEEAHKGKELVPIQKNAEKFRKIIEFFKEKGGEPEITPSELSMDTFHVQVKITFKDEFTFNRRELDTLTWIMGNTVEFEIFTPYKGREIKIGFAFRDLGKYVDKNEGAE